MASSNAGPGSSTLEAFRRTTGLICVAWGLLMLGLALPIVREGRESYIGYFDLLFTFEGSHVPLFYLYHAAFVGAGAFSAFNYAQADRALFMLWGVGLAHILWALGLPVGKVNPRLAAALDIEIGIAQASICGGLVCLVLPAVRRAWLSRRSS